MGSTEPGVNISRNAIKAARTDLVEALKLLRPDRADGEQGSVQPVLTKGGAVDRLSTDSFAISGIWPAALGFQNSTNSAVSAVSVSYHNLVTQVESVVELLTQALRNYDAAEGAGDGAEQRVQA